MCPVPETTFWNNKITIVSLIRSTIGHELFAGTCRFLIPVPGSKMVIAAIFIARYRPFEIQMEVISFNSHERAITDPPLDSKYF